MLPDILDKSFKKTIEKARTSLVQIRLERNQFETRLYERWRKPIDMLEIFINVCLNEGSKVNTQYRKEAALSKDYAFDVLTRLHARACQISLEIFTLLKSGLPEGAHARWRTLHEVAVVSYFIGEKGRNIAERYLKFQTIETYNEALVFQKYAKRLGYEPFRDEEMQILRKSRDNVIGEYGKDFDCEYGWIPKEIISARNFAKLEEYMKFGHLRPYYKWACHNVHSGPKGMTSKLGILRKAGEGQVLLAGSSNYGLADPGQSCALSLGQITVGLLAFRSRVYMTVEKSPKSMLETLVKLIVILELVDDISEAFCEVQSQMESEEKELN